MKSTSAPPTALREHMRRALVIATLCAIPAAATAQQPAHRDTVFLDELQRAAVASDPRSAQSEFFTAQSARRLATLRNERLPSLSIVGAANYLSDVAGIGAILPGAMIPGVSHDQYDTHLALRAPLFDPTRSRRAAIESAQDAESQARLRATLWQQRLAVTDAFFGVLLRDSQLRSLDAVIDDISSRSVVAQKRVAEGVALRSEALLLQAELERRRQSRDELVIEREAARDVLTSLTGRSLGTSAVLATRSEVYRSISARIDADTVRARPEFEQFATTQALIDARRQSIGALDLPRVSAVARTGYGRPGLNPLGRAFDSYWIAGVQVEWAPWTWGRTQRDQEVQSLQSRVVASEEAAFRSVLHRTLITERARISALERGLQTDDSVLVLRDRILAESRLRFDEGEMTAPEYIARLTEQLTAALDRDTRRLRLDEARARYLTTLGLEIR